MVSSEKISELNKRLDDLFKYLSIEKKEKKVLELETITRSNNFWDNPEEAQKTLKQLSKVKIWVITYNKVKNNIDELKVLEEFAKEGECTDEEINSQLKKTIKSLEDLEFKNMLSAEEDSMSAIMTINPGAGGTESQDWADMLRRMYMKWFDKKNFRYEIISEHKGEEAGIKSSIVKVTGDYLYGLMKSESGVHRLVRISPFDSGARRHTSFASVWVYPVVEDDINIKIDEKDLRIDTYRSSGAGGQHVNTTDSAVRITHIPTKIVVQCQNERSQHKNKETCYKMLKARLYEHEMQKKEEENQKELNTKTDIGWGHQIRSYVLQPYQLVKDLRNKTESTNPSSILDGNIDLFIEEGIKNK